jgi:predicted methyltransferase
MAEIIDRDLLVGTLRYLDAQENGETAGITVDTRQTTHSVVMELLMKSGFVNTEGKVSPKGERFLEQNKLRDLFKIKYTPYGVEYEGNGNGFVSEVTEILKSRPVANHSLDHQPLWPELTAMRAHYISSEENLFDKKVAMVGDYDSAGLALNLITSVKETTVFDIDKRLLRYFGQVARKHNFSLKRVYQDLFKKTPNKYIGKYDVFVADPPYAMGGMRKFIEFGIDLLKDGGTGYIAVPYHENIAWTERMLFEVGKLVMKRGCVITDVLKNFHRYQTADGLRSSIIRIKKGAFLKEIDVDKMYSYKKININKPEILAMTI